jgi:hypothetical protein
MIDEVSINRGQDAVIMRCEGDHRSPLIAALKQLGVTQAESNIHGIEGRLFHSANGGSKFEIRVAAWQDGYAA